MATTLNLKPGLDRKQWEHCTPAPNVTAAGCFIVSSPLADQYKFYVASATLAYIYDPTMDSWVQLTSPALGGTFGAGASGCVSHWRAPQTASAGSTSTTLNTAITSMRDVRGYSVRITGGTGIGQERVISSNTIGTNAVFTVPAWTVTPDNTSTFVVMTPKLYIISAGTMSASTFMFYDILTNVWTAKAYANLPGTIGTDGKLLQTCGSVPGGAPGQGPLMTATATSATGTTLVLSTANWSANWANSQVRIVSGTGAGQVRIITSNTTTTLTVPAWTITPDATSVFNIEGNDDVLYYIGNNAVTMYKYTISTDTWSTVSPGVARAGAPVAGCNGVWVNSSTDAVWSAMNTCLNGRRIYSFRGTGAVIDYYDIALNNWVSGVASSPNNESFASGTFWTYYDSYIFGSSAATGRWMRFNVVTQQLEPWSTDLYPQGAAVVGDKGFNYTFVDGATQLHFVYYIGHTLTVMRRCLAF